MSSSQSAPDHCIIIVHKSIHAHIYTHVYSVWARVDVEQPMIFDSENKR